jgi:DNA-binding GntR family transcriptional regulator
MSPIDPLSGTFTYIQVADDLALRIRAGELAGKLPPERDLASQYGVAYPTLRRSMELLRERKLILTRQGRGIFVTPPDPDLAPFN